MNSDQSRFIAELLAESAQSKQTIVALIAEIVKLRREIDHRDGHIAELQCRVALADGGVR